MGTQLVRGEGLTPARDSLLVTARRQDTIRPALARAALPAVFASFLSLFVACQPARTPATRRPAQPMIRATVITIRTALRPSNKTVAHTIVVSGDLARSTEEADRWRLFDLRNQRVTFVDEIAKTRRTETLDALRRRRSSALAAAVPAGTPRVEFTADGASRTLQGVRATRVMLRSGAYVRELWVGSHPAIPSGLFAMMLASDPISSPLAPMMQSADKALLDLAGFPLAEHAELPFGSKTLVADRTVLRIEKKDVPRALLEVPPAFREPAASPPAASSPPRGRTTPAEGLRSFVKGRTAP
jgi:hypothetical protein